MDVLPPIEAGQRLFICAGTPWRDAIEDVEGTADVWVVDRTYRKGDWILSYISSKPRVFLYWEQAIRDATKSGNIWVNTETAELFSNLVVVDDIERETGLNIKVSGVFNEPQARIIRDALVEHLRHPRPWHGIEVSLDSGIH